MKNAPISIEQRAAPKRAAPAQRKAAPAKTTKHGREVVRLLKELGKFEWDEKAMKRA